MKNKILVLAAAVMFVLRPAAAENAGIHLLCATYPIQLLTRVVVEGVALTSVDLLVPAGSGCPHDYVLTPADMRKLMRADAVIVNGLGLDDFLPAALKKAQSEARLIDTSAGLTDLLPARRPAEVQGHRHGHDHGGHHDCRQADCRDLNPHLFASPRLAARLVGTIAGELAGIDPPNSEEYLANGRRAAARLEKLSSVMNDRARDFKRGGIVAQHDIFDYLARDLGIEVVTVIQGHHGREPTAAELRRLTAIIRENDVRVLVTEPQYRKTVVTVLSLETGVPAITLDPLASGPADGNLDHYEAVMLANLEKLARVMR